MIHNFKHKIELAWAAGFYDGEGCCFGSNKQFQISVAQVFRPNLVRFQNAIGGIGSISRPYHKGGKPISFWRAYGDNGILVCRTIFSLIGEEKQDQILKSFFKYSFRNVFHVKSCARGHLIEIVGRYKDGDCNECRKLRKLGTLLPEKLPIPTAIALRLHGIREYQPAQN